MPPVWHLLLPSAYLVVRVCVTFICAVIVVLRPAAQLGGPYLFLILDMKDLVFPPSTSLSAQIEATVVNMGGALFGLGWSNLGLVCATYAARKYGVDSNACRAIRAIFLLILGFLTGLARSWLPRLTLAARGAGFIGTLLLTIEMDSTKWAYTSLTQLLFVCAIACAASLCVAFVARIFVHPGGYAKDVIDTLELLKDLVRLATTQAIEPPLPIEPPLSSTTWSSSTLTLTANLMPTNPPPSVEALRKSYQQAVFSLPASYAYSAFELRIGRVHISHIEYLISTAERIRSGLDFGVARAGSHTQLDQGGAYGNDDLVGHTDGHPSIDELKLLASLDDSSHSCAKAIEEGIAALQNAIGLCYGIKVLAEVCRPHPQSSADMNAKEVSSGLKQPNSYVKRSVLKSEDCLSDLRTKGARLEEARVALQEVLDSTDQGMKHAHISPWRSRYASGSRSVYPSRIPGAWNAMVHPPVRKRLYAISLVHTSLEIIDALTRTTDVLIRHMSGLPRIFLPRPSWLWLGMSPRAHVMERMQKEPSLYQGIPTCYSSSRKDVDDLHGSGGLPEQEVKPGLPFPVASGERPVPFRQNLNRRQAPRATETTWTSIKRGLYYIRDLPQRMLETLWNQAKVLTSREKLSRLMRRIKHSKHAQHAVKNTVGIMLLAVPAFLPLGSPGRKYFISERGFWAIVSFLYVLEPNTALTWRVGMMRLCGTFVGAVYAYIAWVICRENPYGLVAAVTVGEIMVTRLIRSSTPGVGVVASITIPPIIFTPYLGLPHPSVIGLAATRGAQISIGIVAAILVNHFLFPRHCRVLFLSGMARVLAGMTQSFLHITNCTPNSGTGTRGEMLEKQLREMISEENLLLKQMENEISLMTKPINLYQQGMEAVQRIAELMSELRRIRATSHQGEAARQPLRHQQHTVSYIFLALFVCEHAFRSRQPLPQILPSPRETSGKEPRATDAVHIAESEVNDELIDALETLLAITRELFGTNTWLPNGSCDSVESLVHGQAWTGAGTPWV